METKKYKYDFLEGMSSVASIRGDSYFNDFTDYPEPATAIKKHWQNAGSYFGYAVNKGIDIRDLPNKNKSTEKL